MGRPSLGKHINLAETAVRRGSGGAAAGQRLHSRKVSRQSSFRANVCLAAIAIETASEIYEINLARGIQAGQWRVQ
jgi:hypothetical protein